MDIGFIGLGNMGFLMARRLIEAGHRLVVCDTRKEAVDRLIALGAQAASSPKDIADRVGRLGEVVIRDMGAEFGLYIRDPADREGGGRRGERQPGRSRGEVILAPLSFPRFAGATSKL